MEKKKVILAYSGGLDTTTIIPWLKENYDYEIIAVCVDVGQGNEMDGMLERALEAGASKLYIDDVRKEFVEDYIYPTLKSGAVYEGNYLLGTCMARPLIAKSLVKYAKLEGAEAICHGATGKGNDQVRFELGIKALAPNMKIIAPWREWNIKSREDAIGYCQQFDVKMNVSAEESYSRDKNLWHISHEGLDLEDPNATPDYDSLLKLTVTPAKAPDKTEDVEIEFVEGIPVKVNGEDLDSIAIIEKLNEIAGRNGVGIQDIIENRIVGMKSRGVYETPGGTILYHAHQYLEQLSLDRETFAFNNIVATQFAEILYSGQWFSPLREALSSYVDNMQKVVTGTVKLQLYKGNITNKGVTSPFSLYNEEIASFTTGELYSHKDAEGFINLFGLPIKVQALMREAKLKEAKK